MINKTLKQIEAVKLLGSNAKHCMLFGGSRSGKTFLLVYAMVVRASKVKSKHLILRLNFNHVKRSIWLDTLPKVIKLCFPDLGITESSYNKSDYYLKLPNGSEIWIGGLDSKDRVEKILGNEYSTLYFNESSQMDYSSVQMAITRLAEKNDLKKKVYYDCNPPKKSHWSYPLFIKKLNPVDSDPLKHPDKYGSLLMNPKDNLANIDEEYLELLEAMPEKERNRFLEGLFGDDNDGLAYYAFKSDHITDSVKRVNGTLFIGQDYNVNPSTALPCQVVNDELWVLDEAFLLNSDTYKMADYLTANNYNGVIIPDSTGGNRKTSGISDFQIMQGANFKIITVHNPLQRDRVNNVNRLLTAGKIKIHPRCKKLINDLNKVEWDKNGKLDEGTDKMLTHISDCLGYICWKLLPMTPMSVGVSQMDR